MTKIFSVNENNDIFANSQGGLAIIRGLPAILQHCEHVMKVRLGEMIYDKNRGIEFLTNVFSGSPNLLLFESQARSLLASVEGVISVNDLIFRVENNTFFYSATIQTTEGNGVINGNL